MLFIRLLERMSIIALAAYIFSHTYIFRKIVKNKLTLTDRVLMVSFFSILSILGTYMGIIVDPQNFTSLDFGTYMKELESEALANTRPIGAIVAGYFGGPVIGIIVGIISGTHRYFIGGFTALACAVATVFEGLIGGIAGRDKRDGKFGTMAAFFAGIIAEFIQMTIIILISKPFENAVELEKMIAIPMILVNSTGAAIFVDIINHTRDEYSRIGAFHAQKALNIAKRTIHYLRKGLNKETAQKVAEIIYKIGESKGVFIGDKHELLVYCGKSIEFQKLRTFMEEYYNYPKFGTMTFKHSNKILTFYCVPLLIQDRDFEGVLGIEVERAGEMDKYFVEYMKGIGELLSTQIELYKLNKLAQEASTAELKALQAQIHPHFLFNALNTIASFCRTNSLIARELIMDLSNYFRKTLKRENDFVKVKEEIELINSYLSIERARFGDRLKLHIDIPDNIMQVKIPVFLLQPIVENSVKHGISPKPSGGSIFIKAFEKGNEFVFIVEDTGVGMTRERLNTILREWPGIGLRNINERLKFIYGDNYKFEISSSIEEGTRVSIRVPKEDGINENS